MEFVSSNYGITPVSVEHPKYDPKENGYGFFDNIRSLRESILQRRIVNYPLIGEAVVYRNAYLHKTPTGFKLDYLLGENQTSHVEIQVQANGFPKVVSDSLDYIEVENP